MADFVPGGRRRGRRRRLPRDAAEVPLLKDGDINLEALPAIDADLKLPPTMSSVPEFLFDRLAGRSQAARSGGGDRCDRRGQVPRAAAELRDRTPAPTDSLEDPDASLPGRLALQSEETRLTAKGSVDRPLEPDRSRRRRDARRPRPRELGDILQLPLPRRRPTTSRARSPTSRTRSAGTWSRCAARSATATLRATSSFELAGERPTLVADLRSEQLDFDDLGRAGRRADRSRRARPRPRSRGRRRPRREAERYVLPDEPFDVPELRAIDARVKFEAASRPGQEAAARAHEPRAHAGRRQADRSSRCASTWPTASSRRCMTSTARATCWTASSI